MSEIVKEAWKKYLTQLQLHPLRTKAITAGVLVGSSDVIAQKISGVKRLQVKRILLLMVLVYFYYNLRPPNLDWEIIVLFIDSFCRLFMVVI